MRRVLLNPYTKNNNLKLFEDEVPRSGLAEKRSPGGVKFETLKLG